MSSPRDAASRSPHSSGTTHSPRRRDAAIEYAGVRTTCTAAGVAFFGGRGRASSAAACPSLGGRTPTSFTTARHPRTGAQERLAVGGAEAWPQVHPGVVRGARAAAGL